MMMIQHHRWKSVDLSTVPLVIAGGGIARGITDSKDQLIKYFKNKTQYLEREEQ